MKRDNLIIKYSINIFIIFTLILCSIPNTPIVVAEDSNENIQLPDENIGDQSELSEGASQNSKTAESRTPEYAPGQLIVKLKDGNTLDDIRELNDKYGVTSTEKVFKDTTNPEDTLKQLKGKLDKFSPDQPGWYWQMDKDSKESKDYMTRIEKEKEDLTKQVKAQEELIIRLEERQKRAPENAVIPNLEYIYILKTDETTDISAMAEDYKADPAVEYAEPVYQQKNPGNFSTEF